MNPNRLDEFINRNLYIPEENEEATYCTAIIPDISELLEKEIEKKLVIEGFEHFRISQPTLSFIFPKYFKEKDLYKKKLREIDYEIDEILVSKEKGSMKASRTAFVCLKSFANIELLKEKFE